MTDPSDAAKDFVLYGLDDKGKPRAGLVPGADRDVALAIAAALNFNYSRSRPLRGDSRRRAFADLSERKRLLGRASRPTRSFRRHRKSIARTGKLGA
jgi:hypothetical protein